MMIFRNMTPHPIDIYRNDADSVLATIPPSGNIVRLKETDGLTGGQAWLDIDTVQVKVWDHTENYALSVPCVTRSWGEVDTAMPQVEGTVYIVAMPVLSALPARPDVCCPDFGDGAVRNSRSTIIGTRRFVFKDIPTGEGDAEGWRWTGPLHELLEATAKEMVSARIENRSTAKSPA